jgi:DNA-binding transcriptional ArsR family regulator
MRKHSVAKSKVAVLDALFPSVRQHILGTILAEPDRWWYLSELAHHLATTPSSLQRELLSLVNAGILEERRDGTRTYFRAQQGSPTYRNLRDIFAKTQEGRKKSPSPVRPKIKAILVAASRKAGLSLSSFILRSGLKRAAAMRKCGVTDLIPAAELAQYV